MFILFYKKQNKIFKIKLYQIRKYQMITYRNSLISYPKIIRKIQINNKNN